MDVGPGQSALGAQESHERGVRRRRALIVGLFALFGVVANVPTMSGLGSSQALVNVLLLPVPVALAAVSLWRRERLGDRGFLAVVVTMIVALTPDLLVTTPAGSLRSAELVLLGPLVVAAMFCGSRWHVALVMVAAVGGANLISLHRLAGRPDAGSEIIGEVVTFVLITVVVRALRDSAETALAAARQGELTDPLTGLLNRRGFERSAGEAWSRRAHDRKPVALIVLDIDHFKMVNDTLGHAAGDAVLRRLAALLRTALREEDVAVRLGGEEFAVLATGEPGDGQRLAERLRQLVEAEMAPVTVSVGVVEPEPEPAPVREDQVAALWRAMERADTGLYEAKRSGRNRVVVMPD